MILAPSPKYTGLREEAPRFMGDGFDVARFSKVDIYYYQDEPGRVPIGPEEPAADPAGSAGTHSDNASDRQTTASGSSSGAR